MRETAFMGRGTIKKQIDTYLIQSQRIGKRLEQIEQEMQELQKEKIRYQRRMQILNIEIKSLEQQIAAFEDPSLDNKNMMSLF
jgi:chromosome segregation ATPase